MALAALGHKSGVDPGKAVGGLYAANTFGAIVGSIGVSLFAMPYGGRFVQQLLTLISGVSGLVMIVALIWPHRAFRIDARLAAGRTQFSLTGFAQIAAVAVMCLMAVWAVPSTPHELLADGRSIRRWADSASYVYVAEGLDSPIVVSDLEDGTRCFHVAGKVEASTRERDLRTQRLLGHLPAMAHQSPKKVLVIGCGSGMTAGSFLLHSSVEQIVLCELEKCVIDAARDHFEAYNYGVVSDPRTRIIHDDARHFLATTQESFDIITVDPIHPWVKGAAALYTTEFFQLCKSHLNQNGIVTLWAPLYESNEATVKCEIATFLQQFPHATLWSGQSQHVGYDLVIVASTEEVIDVERMAGKLTSSTLLQFSFAEIGLASVGALVNCLAAEGHDLRDWLRDAQINRDRNLRLQYLAGTNPDHALEQQILQTIVSARDRARQESIPTVTVIAPGDHGLWLP